MMLMMILVGLCGGEGATSNQASCHVFMFIIVMGLRVIT